MEIDAFSWIVIAWSALCMQLVIVPFINKREKLFEVFSQSGTIDAAISRIDSESVMPELASIFERAIAQREDARRKIEIESLLAQVSFSDSLERLTKAVAKKSDILDVYASVKKIVQNIWVFGFIHLIALVLSIVSLYFLPRADVAILTAVFLWTISFIAMLVSVVNLLSFERKHQKLVSLVELQHA